MDGGPVRAAVIKDGFLYGRGSSDDKTMRPQTWKSCCSCIGRKCRSTATSFIWRKPERKGRRAGLGYMVNEHWDRIDCEFALAEGGSTMIRDGKVRYVASAATEKVGAACAWSRAHIWTRVGAAARQSDFAPCGGGRESRPIPGSHADERHHPDFFQAPGGDPSPPRKPFLYTHLEDPLSVPWCRRHCAGNICSTTRCSDFHLADDFRRDSAAT